MSLFYYPRGWVTPGRDRGRHGLPPSYVGEIGRPDGLSLAKTLENQMERFSMARRLTTSGQVRIDLSRDGTRKVITGRRIWPTSIYPSRKCGAAIVCEGGDELLFATQCEIDPGVVGYASQAVHFSVQVDGKAREYHADFVRKLANGAIEIVEVKPNPKHLLKPAYQAKLEVVGSLCKAIGWRFRTVFGEDLRQRTFFNFHASQINAERFSRLRPSIEDAILEAVSAARDGVGVGELASVCGNLPEARVAICSLVCRSILRVDLTQSIRSETIVRLVDRRAT